MTRTETYEEQARDRVKNQPDNMKLLVVVDKLLVGFDAPSCTYLFIDKTMHPARGSVRLVGSGCGVGKSLSKTSPKTTKKGHQSLVKTTSGLEHPRPAPKNLNSMES